MGTMELREVQALSQETQQQNIKQSTIFLNAPSNTQHTLDRCRDPPGACHYTKTNA